MDDSQYDEATLAKNNQIISISYGLVKDALRSAGVFESDIDIFKSNNLVKNYVFTGAGLFVNASNGDVCNKYIRVAWLIIKPLLNGRYVIIFVNYCPNRNC